MDWSALFDNATFLVSTYLHKPKVLNKDESYYLDDDCVRETLLSQHQQTNLKANIPFYDKAPFV